VARQSQNLTHWSVLADWESVWVEFFGQAMREIHERPNESLNLFALANQILLGDGKSPDKLPVVSLHHAAKLQNARLKVGMVNMAICNVVPELNDGFQLAEKLDRFVPTADSAEVGRAFRVMSAT